VLSKSAEQNTATNTELPDRAREHSYICTFLYVLRQAVENQAGVAISGAGNYRRTLGIKTQQGLLAVK
jgi:hypothetical protein